MGKVKTIAQLIEENKQELLKDKDAIDKIEKRIDAKYDTNR